MGNYSNIWTFLMDETFTTRFWLPVKVIEIRTIFIAEIFHTTYATLFWKFKYFIWISNICLIGTLLKIMRVYTMLEEVFNIINVHLFLFHTKNPNITFSYHLTLINNHQNSKTRKLMMYAIQIFLITDLSFLRNGFNFL